MRYFSYNEYDPGHLDGGYVVTVSEEEIKKNYWPYWYKKMCERFGKEHVDATYCFEDCLDDWKVINWAWPADD